MALEEGRGETNGLEKTQQHHKWVCQNLNSTSTLRNTSQNRFSYRCFIPLHSVGGIAQLLKAQDAYTYTRGLIPTYADLSY